MEPQRFAAETLTHFSLITGRKLEFLSAWHSRRSRGFWREAKSSSSFLTDLAPFSAQSGTQPALQLQRIESMKVGTSVATSFTSSSRTARYPAM